MKKTHGERGTITLLTGGARSGKSSYALQLSSGYEKKGFIASAIPFDEEMRSRIERHKLERDQSFLIREEPYDLAQAITTLGPEVDVLLIDCLTVWLGNLYHRGAGSGPEIERFLEVLSDPPCDLIIVTNEVGLGIVPENDQVRKFRDSAGLINQNVARRAHIVVFMISGIPLLVKGEADEKTHPNNPSDSSSGEKP